MSVVGRLKEELSGVGLKVWTMCLRCSWSTSIRDTCTMEEGEGGREGGRVCIYMYMHVVVYVCHVCVYTYMYIVVRAFVHVCAHGRTLYSNGHFKRGSNSPLMRTKKTEK